MRPNILLAKEDADAVIDRGAFAAGEDFNDKDTDTPGFEQKFIVNVLNTTADAATIRVRYAADVKPDPGITPWSASTNWQSPDLEVINARSILDPAFHNIPWEGHDNIVTAKVTNRGSSDAHGVTVKFFSKDLTLGFGVEVSLGSQTLDIPANNTTVTFTAPETWVPAALKYGFDQFQYYQHSCIFARIDPFTDPVTNILEVTPENNEAQSNYTWMASTTSSPASREVTVVLVDNPFDKPAIVYFTVDQPHPLFRVYVNHRWLYLEPGEQRQILVMAESLLGDRRFNRITEGFQHGERRERRIATNVRLSAIGDTKENCAGVVIGGATIQVMTGIGTRFTSFAITTGRTNGFVARSDNGNGVDGKVLVSVMPQDSRTRRAEITREAQAIAGRFQLKLEIPRGSRVQAFYLGGYPYGPCESKSIDV